jgi:hypothetical protein
MTDIHPGRLGLFRDPASFMFFTIHESGAFRIG